MSALPKIPLDSSADLAFLRLQLQQALSASLQKHLPNALPEDSFRTLIESHISKFLSTTMQESIPNITINGMDPKPSDIAKGVQVEPEAYETFDTALQASVLAKHEELEDMITRVTTMRREIPAQIKSIVETRTLQESERETQKGDVEMQPEEVLLAGSDKDIQIARADEVQQTYDASVKILREMKSNVGAVNAKAQRAKEVLTFIQQQQQAVAKA